MKRRPVLFASATVVGVWSAWIVWHGQPGSGHVVAASESPRRAPAPQSTRVAEAGRVDASADPASSASRTRLAATGEDAFASREWHRPPPPPPPSPPPPPPPPAPPPPPPPPPVLPYRFVGLLDEGRGGKPRVFLSLGDKLLVAGVGDRLEGGYQLVAISAQELVFQHVQNNVTLKLAVAGGSS